LLVSIFLMSNTYRSKQFRRSKDYKTIVQRLMSEYQRKASAKSREFSLDYSLFESLIMSYCYFCNLKPSNFRLGLKYSGLRRLDLDLGFIPENTVACCKQCNSKNKLDYSKIAKPKKKSLNFVRPSRFPGSAAPIAKSRTTKLERA
jgi:hypothetical protein